MHQIFTTEDVLYVVFSTFATGRIQESITPETKANRQVLLNLALSCSAFKDPGLDILWRGLISLDPLLRLLPKDVIDKVGGSWKYDRPPKKDDWTRFRLYSPRVIHLRLRCARGNQEEPVYFKRGVPPSSMHPRNGFMFLHHGYTLSYTGSMLPRLRTLLFYPSRTSDFLACPMLMGPTLQTFHTSFSNLHDGTDIPGGSLIMFDALAYCPTLHELHLPSPSPRAVDIGSESCVRMLCSLESLKEIQVGVEFLDDDSLYGVVECLAEARGLKQITLVGEGETDWEPTKTEEMREPSAMGRRVFAELNALEMDHTILWVFLPFIRRDQITNIATSGLTAGSDETSTERFHKLFSLIAKNCSQLEQLATTFTGWSKDCHSSLDSIQSFFLPILSHCNLLSNLSIVFDKTCMAKCPNLSDEDYVYVCHGLPNLRSFRLRLLEPGIRDMTLAPRATLQAALHAFSSFCTELRTLVLGTNFDWDPEILLPKKTFSALDVLDLTETMVRVAGEGKAKTITKRLAKPDAQVWSYVSAIAVGAAIRLGEPQPWSST